MATTLVYPYPSFTTGTAISSTQVIGNFNAVATLLNSTQLTADNIQALAITSALLAANAVTGAKLNSNVVDNSTLQYSSSQLSIKAGGVGTSQLADASVTQAKLAAVNYVLTSSSSSYSTASTSYVQPTNLSVSFTSTGRPVCVTLVHDGSSNAGQIAAANGGSVQAAFTIKFTDGADIAIWTINSQQGTNSAISVPGSSFQHIYVPSAATRTYTCQVLANNSGNTVYVTYCKLIVFEM